MYVTKNCNLIPPFQSYHTFQRHWKIFTLSLNLHTSGVHKTIPRNHPFPHLHNQTQRRHSPDQRTISLAPVKNPLRESTQQRWPTKTNPKPSPAAITTTLRRSHNPSPPPSMAPSKASPTTLRRSRTPPSASLTRFRRPAPSTPPPLLRPTTRATKPFPVWLCASVFSSFF